jgi:hypothetical protein
MGAGAATPCIRGGDIVTVDGGAGTITCQGGPEK